MTFHRTEESRSSMHFVSCASAPSKGRLAGAVGPVRSETHPGGRRRYGPGDAQRIQ
jgi:hypothetical protein